MHDDGEQPKGDSPPAPDPWTPLPSRKGLRDLGNLFREPKSEPPEPGEPADDPPR